MKKKHTYGANSDKGKNYKAKKRKFDNVHTIYTPQSGKYDKKFPP